LSERLEAGSNIERLAGSFDSLEVGEVAARQQEKEFRPRGYSAGDKDKGRLASILSFGRRNRKDPGAGQSESSSLDSMTAGSSLLKSFAWPLKVMLKLEQQEKLQSIGYKNIAMSDKHVNASGDVMLLVRLSIIKKEEPCHSLSSDLGSLINDEASSDLILEAGERRFRVHRNILAARSPVFASLLTQLEREKKAAVKKLVIENLPGDTVEELLRYIYTDNSNNVDLFSQKLLAASDIYQLPGLKVQCEKHLGETINPVNVAEILLLSDSYSCQHLKKAALSYCSENHSYIMKDSQWKIIEEENPKLYSQAISEIAPETCSKHVDCIKRGGNRYETEKENAASGKKKHSVLKKYSQ